MRISDVPELFNLTDYFVDRNLSNGLADKVAVIANGQKFTYAEVAELANQAGNALLQLGVQEEQRVLLLLPDSVEFIAAFFGAIKIGAVPVPTNTALSPSDYAYFLDESRARVLFVHASLYPQVESILGSRLYLRHVMVVGGECKDSLKWTQAVLRCSSRLEVAPTSRDDVAFWLWTSGSTGTPKAAVHLQHDWSYCCESYAREVMDIKSSDVTFSTSKLYHAYGLGNGLMFPFYVGATTVLESARAKAKLVLDKIKQLRPSLFFSVPTLYAAMLAEADQNDSCDLSSVRVAVSAGEPLPAELFRKWWDRFGSEILDGIGSTETLHIFMSARPGEIRPGSTGKPLPGYDVRIVDDNGLDVSPGEIGDLIVAGESNAPSYWKRHALTNERMLGKWFVTGDKYRTDGDGYFWYMGRCDDMFRVSGQWVSPIEVEGALMEHPAVLEAAVVPYREPNEIHTPKAFVVVKGMFPADEALMLELQQFVKARITPHKYPRHIEFVEELPKTAAGKLLRRKLRTR